MMKKRLRKKYHLKEFRELCFEVTFRYKGKTMSQEGELFWDSFITECIEGNGLICAGSTSDESWDFTAHSINKPTTAEEKRNAVKKWLKNRDDVEEVYCGDFKDAWYD